MTSDGNEEFTSVNVGIILSNKRHDDDRLAFLITRGAWKRLKRKARQIRPAVPWWAILGSLFAGGSLACLTSFIIEFFGNPPRQIPLIINGLLAAFMAVLSVVCLFSDFNQRKMVTDNADEIIVEMDVIETSNPDIFPTIGESADINNT